MLSLRLHISPASKSVHPYLYCKPGEHDPGSQSVRVGYLNFIFLFTTKEIIFSWRFPKEPITGFLDAEW